MPKFDESSGFIVISRISVSKQNLRDYIEIAEQTSIGIQKTEESLLHQTFDQDSSEELSLCWTEFYHNEKAFAAHLNNPIYRLYLANHNSLGKQYLMEIYGTIGEQTIELLENIGLQFKIYKRMLGFSRI